MSTPETLWIFDDPIILEDDEKSRLEQISRHSAFTRTKRSDEVVTRLADEALIDGKRTPGGRGWTWTISLFGRMWLENCHEISPPLTLDTVRERINALWAEMTAEGKP